MSNVFINTEIDKIMNEEGFEFPQNLAMACTWILGNFKGINLKVLDMREKSSLADFFVLGSATNATTASAMADEIVVQAKRSGYMPLSKEGMKESDWILLDIGDVLVHIFLDTAREVYGLDHLWADAPQITIPHSYYFAGDEREELASTKDEKDRDFF